MRWPFVLFTCTLAVCTFTHAAEERNVEVVSVVRGDSLKIAENGAARLVALYGVKCPDNGKRLSSDAKEFVKQQAAGRSVTIRIVKIIAGFEYVEVLVDGQVLNESLVSRGLAQVDSLSAHDDAHYRELEAAAKQAEAGIWAPILTLDAPESRPSAAASTGTSSIDFQRRRSIVELAEFEAELVKWVTLPPRYRTALINHYTRARESEAGENMARLEEHTAVAAEHSAELFAHQLDLQALTAEERAAYEDVYDDYSLSVNTAAQNLYWKEAMAKASTGSVWTEYYARKSHEYAVKSAIDQARVDAEAAEVASHYNALKTQHLKAMEHHESQMRRAEGMQRAASGIAANTDRRLANAISRLALLDLAAFEGYVPALRPKRIHRFTDVTAPFRIDSDVWRVDWYVARRNPHAAVTIDLYKQGETRPITRLNSSALAHKAYSIQQGQGTYRLEVKRQGDAQFSIDVFEVQEVQGAIPAGSIPLQLDRPSVEFPANSTELPMRRIEDAPARTVDASGAPGPRRRN